MDRASLMVCRSLRMKTALSIQSRFIKHTLLKLSKLIRLNLMRNSCRVADSLLLLQPM